MRVGEIVVRTRICAKRAIVFSKFIQFRGRVDTIKGVSRCIPRSNRRIVSTTKDELIPKFVSIRDRNKCNISGVSNSTRSVGQVVTTVRQRKVADCFPAAVARSSRGVRETLVNVHGTSRGGPIVRNVRLRKPFVSIIRGKTRPRRRVGLPSTTLVHG